uniref:Uncharacterized protein n=1 Tax=Penaeus semisulcatus majanivirus TaxID=2984274 RepID=A0A9C7CEQ8_9VIRU|nr:MAG: hypothetical protein [Penaeus semisulcatus majanivirus]
MTTGNNINKKRRRDKPIKLCIECDPPLFSKKERLDERNIREHMLKSCICWIPRVKKSEVYILCLCSSATNAFELRRVARVVDFCLSYIKQMYEIRLQQSYLVSPTGYSVLLHKSSNSNSSSGNSSSSNVRSNKPILSLMDVWISTAKSETMRFFQDPKNIDNHIPNTHFGNSNKNVDEILGACLSRVKYVPQ